MRNLQYGLSCTIHDSLKNYIKTKNISYERHQAKQLEILMQQLFTYFRTPTQQLGIEPLPQEVILQLQSLGIPSNLFDFYDDQSIGVFQQGNLFEERLSQLFETLFSTHTPIQVGSRQVTSATPVSIQDLSIPGNLKVVIPKEVNGKIVEYVNTTLKEARNQNAKIVYLANASGVIDLSLPKSNLTLEYQPTAFINSLISLLKGMNITAKSYTHMTSISTGNTSMQRMLQSILPEIGLGNQIQEIRKYLLTPPKEEKKEAALHRSHLTYAYQVLGIGQYIDINGVLEKLSETNYLVVFDRTAQTIRVRSTKALVEDYVNNSTSIAKKPVINLLKTF